MHIFLMILYKRCAVTLGNNIAALDGKCFGYAATMFLELEGHPPKLDRSPPILDPWKIGLVNRLQDEHEGCSNKMPASLSDFSAETVAKALFLSLPARAYSDDDCKEIVGFSKQFLARRQILFISVWRSNAPGHTFLLDNRLNSIAWIYDINDPQLSTEISVVDTLSILVNWLKCIVFSRPTTNTQIALEAILLQRDTDIL